MTFLFQLDFKPEILKLRISNDKKERCFKNILQKIIKEYNRPDLNQILLQTQKIELNQSIDDYDQKNIFMIHGPEVTFDLYSNIDFQSMRNPSEIKLNLEFTSTEICDEIKKKYADKKALFQPFGVSIYISGGIKLETNLFTFLSNYKPIKLHIYSVIHPDVVVRSLRSRQEILNQYQLSEASQLNVTCLAEYLHHQGDKAFDFIFSICAIVNFPPLPILLISLMQGLTKEPFFHSISLLQTVFLGIYPLGNPETVFDLLPYFCQYICSEYSSSKVFGRDNGQLLYFPDLTPKAPSPFNQLWQPPTKLSLFSNNFYFHCFPTNSIIRSNPPCFAKNGLLLIKKEYQKNIFLNPILNKEIEKPIVSQFYQVLTAGSIRPDIKPTNVKQLIVVLTDFSDHMKQEELFQIENNILKIYTSNSCRYRVMTLHSLISFGVHTILLSKMATYDPNFCSSLRAVQRGGKSNIFKAINDAVDYLNSYNWNEDKIAFPNARYRIVLVTPGINDTETSTLYNDIKEKLLQSEVILDSLIIREASSFTPTIAKLCHFTGGSCVVIDNESTAAKTISQEAFLNIEFRHKTAFGDDSCDTYDAEFPDQMKISSKKKSKLISVQQKLPNPSNELTRRLLQEFRNIQKSVDLPFHVFMEENNLQQWRVIIKAPPEANLDEKWFYLLINFPDDYPSKAPHFKFISIPYHVNISNEGGICLNYLNEEYNPSLTVAYMIICIWELLEDPNYDDPIDISRKALYQKDRNKFLQKIKESAKNGKDSYEDWLKELQEK